MSDKPLASPRIGIVTCGGTIASTAVDGVATPRLGADDLLAAMPWLGAYGALVPRTFMTKASPDVTMADAVQLVRDIGRFADDESLDAVVVTHGTDTLEEVAFVLDLLWDRELPLVVTGAMRNASLPGADGPANLTAAVATAASAEAAGVGVLVVLNDQIHAAHLVRKSHTSNVATFASPTLGPIGFVHEGTASLPFRPRLTRVEGLRPDPRPASVPLLLMGIGTDDLLLRLALDAGVDGIVFAGFGGGHLPDLVAGSAALERALASVPVVLGSRAGGGKPLTSTYGGFAGSETELLARGVISAGRLDPAKARVLLSLCLGSGMTRPEIAAAFDTYR